MNDIFTNMVIPELGDGDFQQSFHDFCTAIKQNIERLMSVQYTKGEPGNSVTTEIMEIGYNNGVLTPASAMFISTIFGVVIPAGTTRADVCDIIEEHAPSITTHDKTFKAIPALMDEDEEPIQITINIDKVTGEAYLASPFIFTDGRIEGLNQIVHGGDLAAYNTFHDFSTAIYGDGKYEHTIEGQETDQDKDKPTTWTWEFENVAIIPKLYFDENIKEFCWKVNGQQTGITAQGIKGDVGESPSMIIATGSVENNIVRIDKVQTIDNNGNVIWMQQDDEYIKVGDLALVFYKSDPNTEVDFNCAFVGKVYKDTNVAPYYVHMGFPDEGRTDIFASIKEHDLWELMMSINCGNTGSPRGYIIPASPDPSPANPTTVPQSHMIYADKGLGGADSAGYGKLHIAPVKTSDTHMSQESNPTTDHIGDMQVDYNVDIKGNSVVQGSSVVKKDSVVQGNVSIQGSVHGNLDVQGNITAHNITISGSLMDEYIKTPKLACMSRFRDVAYILNRSYKCNSQDQYFKYTLVISGTLELNIGMISWFNDADCWRAPQRAISGYGPNWAQGTPYENAFNNDCAQGISFSSKGSTNCSKLYNVIKYNVPFSLTKEVQTPNIPGADASNLFGFGQPVGGSQDWSDVPATKVMVLPTNNTGSLSDINLRFSIDGFNYKQNAKHVGSKHISQYEDVDASMAYSTQGTNVGTQGVDNVIAAVIMGYGTEAQTRREINNTSTNITEARSYQGAVYRLTQNQGIVFGDSGTPDTDEFTINGTLFYPPLGINLNYYFDMFTRILEKDTTYWEHISTNPVSLYKCEYITYHINLNVTPVGYVVAPPKSGYGLSYYAPIWNNINVRNQVSDQINAGNLKFLTGGDSKYEAATPILDKTKLNPLISRAYTKQSSSGGGNGEAGIILSDQDINSYYNVGVFDNLSTDGYYGIGGQRTSCFDITKSMTMVENNIKICPNNIDEGTWKIEDNKYGWVADTPYPYIVIPHSGFIGNQGIGYGSQHQYYALLGCGNIKPYSTNPATQGTPITFNGMLVYPYTPCVITRIPNGPNQYDIPKLQDLYSDTTDPQNIDSMEHNTSYHYIHTGRMMGVTSGDITGITTRISKSSSNIPDDVTPVVPIDPDMYINPGTDPEITD